MPKRSAALLILPTLTGCAQGTVGKDVLLTRQECAEGKKWACDILPQEENDASQEQADNAARTAGALVIVAAGAAAAGYAAAHPQPVYVMPAPAVTQPITTTCQQNGTMTTCTSR